MKVLSCGLMVALFQLSLTPLVEAAELGGAQAASQTSAQNTQAVVNGGVVEVSYDLSGSSGQTFDVVLQVSQDNGQTFAMTAKSVSGDVGSTVAAGPGKHIVWQASQDTDSLQISSFRFRVRASPNAAASLETAATREARASAAQQTPSPIPASKPNAPRQTTTANPYKWTAISMIGGGLALTGLAFGPLHATTNEDHRADLSVPVNSATDMTCLTGGGFINWHEDFSTYLVTCQVPVKKPNVAVIAAGLGSATVGIFLFKRGSKETVHAEIAVGPGELVVRRQFRW